MWLKENAEFLAVLNDGGLKRDLIDLECYRPFYEGSMRYMNFFRQYYRFILSICIDLEDLGLPGSRGLELAEWVAQSQLVDAELSDLQRAEVRRLLARRGVEVKAGVDSGERLDERLRQFTERSHHFAIPNRRTAYELTHILFYLSDYGRCDPQVSPETVQSLYFAGGIAYLDQDPDLLAEVCLALEFTQSAVPDLWRTFLKTSHSQFELSTRPIMVGAMDNYHEYFVLNWFLSRVEGAKLFDTDYTGVKSFIHGRGTSALRGVSMATYSMVENSNSTRGQRALGISWTALRSHVQGGLTQSEQSILAGAEASIPEFETFFTAFSRLSDTVTGSRFQGAQQSDQVASLLEARRTLTPVNV